ncbi:hypothetical protein DXG03_003925 [Asterophora parasitica]|uniref:Protein kinase domain-containing protein n=1 Tax=Asterophora parasitica TaxID=117018 RepID=A0A9P7KAJ2_9AGAR|nr:hypothetical protein DXG03_003925 [Asterophora parasitica]
MTAGSALAKLTLVNATFLRQRGRDSMEIFQAEMHKETEDGQSIVQDVVFKFAEDDEDLFDAMKNEADMCTNHLKPLRGQGVLEFHGLYQGALEPSGTASEPSVCACLVLQSCGNRIRRFSEIDADVRDALVRLVVHLHNLKIIHYNISPRTILDVNGRPFLIDFETSETHHRCLPMRMDIVKARGNPDPPASELGGCTEIYKLLNDLNWWIPSKSL